MVMDDANSVYPFGNDCDALKNNVDYQNLMKAFSKLEAQRIQAVKRLELLHEAKEKYIENPRTLIYTLQKGGNLDLPPPVKVIELPQVDWSNYNIEEIINCSKPKTRKKIIKEEIIRDSKKTNTISQTDSNQNEKPILVRGRIFDRTKPQNFNQHWTLEEQRKLEELLLKYPDEAVSSRRWVKIAKELGTRTPQQVNSRIQKYFLALKREGLPVPGKNPRSMSVILAGKGRRKYLTNRTSFMKAFEFEANSNQYDSDNCNFVKEELNCDPLNINVSDEEDISDEIKDSQEYAEYLNLKKIKKLKLMEIETGEINHPGFGCFNCGVNPIKGTRWHCIQCSVSTYSSLDFCSTCRKSSILTETHLMNHTLTPVNALSVEDTLKVI